MVMPIKELKFVLPDKPFGDSEQFIQKLTTDLQRLSKKAGTENPHFKAAWGKIYKALQEGRNLSSVLTTKIDVRALGIALNMHEKKPKIDERTLRQIDKIVDRPSSLFLENLFQFYLRDYKDLVDIPYISSWLRDARIKRNLNQSSDRDLISATGPNWVAQQAVLRGQDFKQVVSDLGLDQYLSGQFMELSQHIYYVQQLRSIPNNQPHELLHEVQKAAVYNSRFDESNLLGHKVLEILIERAPEHDVNDAWLNTILSIAGDPRTTVASERYIKWWSHINEALVAKVRGWLSGLDLKLFLEALEDFSHASSEPDMLRMFPSRKQFLEGLFDKKLIKNTKLYMCSSMAGFLKRKYKQEHLPEFSLLESSDKSIIYVDLGAAHMIEGTHNCQLWIYRNLHESAPVLRFGKQRKSYRSLTIGLNEDMERYGFGADSHFTHSSAPFSWQRKAVTSLSRLGVLISMKDVLTPDDYRAYIRRFGTE